MQEILRVASRESIPVTPRGGGTGKAGACIPVDGGIVLSVERMNRIKEIDANNRYAVVEPGVILHALHEECAKHDLLYPIDMSSGGSCLMGGNVACDAGGERAVKYGTTRAQVTGCEAVLADGTVIRTGGKLAKDTAGYALHHLITGSEGTLAVMTEITLRLLPLPPYRRTLLAAFDSLDGAAEAALQVEATGFRPSAIELIEHAAVQLAQEMIGASIPHADAAALLLVEIEAFREDDGDAQIEGVAEAILEAGAEDVVLAKREEVWSVRHAVAEAIKTLPAYSAVDSVVPRRRMPELVRAAHAIAEANGIEVACFGHAGDGNIHIDFIRRDAEDPNWDEGGQEGGAGPAGEDRFVRRFDHRRARRRRPAPPRHAAAVRRRHAAGDARAQGRVGPQGDPQSRQGASRVVIGRALLAVCIAAGVCRADSQDDIETVGDVLAIALPLSAGITAGAKRDWAGVKQWALSWGSSALTVELVKANTRKVRPNDQGTNSYASGHMASATSGAAFFQTRYGPAWGVPAYALAAFTGYSRIQADKHFPGDVLTGMSISMLLNWAYVRPYPEDWRIFPKKTAQGYALQFDWLDRETEYFAAADAAPFVRRWRFEWEFGAGDRQANVVQAPPDNGTPIDLADLDDVQDRAYYSRVTLERHFEGHHELALVLAPFGIRDSGTIDGDTTLRTTYTTYDIGLRYRCNLFDDDAFWILRPGAALTWQYTQVELSEDGGDADEESGLVVLPVLHLQAGVNLGDRWQVLGEIDWIELGATAASIAPPTCDGSSRGPGISAPGGAGRSAARTTATSRTSSSSSRFLLALGYSWLAWPDARLLALRGGFPRRSASTAPTAGWTPIRGGRPTPGTASSAMTAKRRSTRRFW